MKCPTRNAIVDGALVLLIGAIALAFILLGTGCYLYRCETCPDKLKTCEAQRDEARRAAKATPPRKGAK